MDLADLLALVLATLAGRAADSVARSPEVASGAGEVIEAEYYALELAPAQQPGQMGPRPLEPVGVAVWRRRALPDGEQVEWQLRFDEEGTDDAHVLHVERIGSARTKLVWREWQSRRGRTLVGDLVADPGELRLLEWGRRETLRRVIPFETDTLLPLDLEERVRRAERVEGRVRVFDPLSRALEPLAVESRAGDDPAHRHVEARRADGSLVRAWDFEGAELVAFQWQAGTLRGRRISAEEYRARLRAIASETGAD